MKITYKPLQRRKSKILNHLKEEGDIDKYWKNATNRMDNECYELEEFSFLEKSEVDLDEGKSSLNRNNEVINEEVVKETNDAVKEKENIKESSADIGGKELVIDEDIKEKELKNDKESPNNNSVVIEENGDVYNFNSLDGSLNMNEEEFNINENFVPKVQEKENTIVENIKSEKRKKNVLRPKENKKRKISKNRNDIKREIKNKKSFFDFNTMKKTEIEESEGENINSNNKADNDALSLNEISYSEMGSISFEKENVERESSHNNEGYDMSLNNTPYNDAINVSFSTGFTGKKKVVLQNKKSALNDFFLPNITAKQSKNTFVPLVLENGLETAILNLQENAYFEENAEKSFSFYVIKGQFKIKKGPDDLILKRDGMVVVNEEEWFSCMGVGKNGNVGIVTYKIK